MRACRARRIPLPFDRGDQAIRGAGSSEMRIGVGHSMNLRKKNEK
jgi:hypothetical protein